MKTRMIACTVTSLGHVVALVSAASAGHKWW